ncbi:hypothetical protein Tco_1171827 [Tanacetum coccineum]
MRCMQWPPISASMIIGPSVPSSSPRSGKKISGLGEKLCVILCLATLSQGWTIRIANALSFPELSSFFAALGCSFSLLCLSSLIKCDSFPALSISLICFFRCIHSSMLCPTSPWNSQNLAWFRFSTGVVIVPEASFLEILLLVTLLLFPWWKRLLPLDFIMETFDEFGVCDSMHESGDSHALWCFLDIPAF